MKKLTSVLSILMIVAANFLTLNVLASYGGGGSSSSINRDNCPDGDYSGSYYDGTCEDGTEETGTEETGTEETGTEETGTEETGTDSGSHGPSLYDLLRERNAGSDGSVGNSNPNYNPSTEVSGENGFTLPGMLAPTGASL